MYIGAQILFQINKKNENGVIFGQKDLAASTGLSESDVSKLINNKRKPRPYTIKKSADAFNVSVENFLSSASIVDNTSINQEMLIRKDLHIIVDSIDDDLLTKAKTFLTCFAERKPLVLYYDENIKIDLRKLINLCGGLE